MPVFILDDDGDVMHMDEQSSGQITISFYDENGDASTPDSIIWHLTDDNGTIINSLEDQSVDPPAEAVDIVLSGDDLQITASEASEKTVKRRLVVEAVIDSDMGDNLPLTGEGVFYVDNLSKLAA